MKKVLLTGLLSFFMGSIYSQTIVSTSPENKNVILEEFTGVNCGFCPQGHAIANGIKNANPNDFFIVNVHAGGFANPGPGQPDFTTTYGDAIDAQASVSGYPAGTINRTVFPGLSQNAGGTAMGRSSWSSATNQVLAQSSYVNVGVEAEINTDTNIITVHVEAYYTADSPVSTNKINIALLQNNTLGPQAGGGMGSNYVHNHRLVKMITGTWGDDITNTTQGTFVDRTYSYYIPADFNGIPADVNTADFEVVAFVAEGQQKIISGTGATATFTSGLLNNDVRINSVEDPGIVCFGDLAPKVEIYNIGTSTVTNLNFTYSANGEAPQNYNWTGSIPSLGIQEVQLPTFQFNVVDNNDLIVTISSDDDDANNSGETSFAYSSESYVTNSVDLTITLDNYPNETTWEILDSSGAILHSGGPYPGQAGQTVNANNLSLANDDCYTFNIYDAYGDGICCGYGNGSYSLNTSSGDAIINGGNFGSGESITYSNYTPLSAEEFSVNSFDVFPNPSNGLITIKANDNFGYEIFDIQGRNILNGVSNTATKELDLTSFNSGIYLVKVSNGDISNTQKIILK